MRTLYINSAAFVPFTCLENPTIWGNSSAQNVFYIFIYIDDWKHNSL
jgi:hypothetical protein